MSLHLNELNDQRFAALMEHVTPVFKGAEELKRGRVCQSCSEHAVDYAD